MPPQQNSGPAPPSYTQAVGAPPNASFPPAPAPTGTAAAAPTAADVAAARATLAAAAAAAAVGPPSASRGPPSSKLSASKRSRPSPDSITIVQGKPADEKHTVMTLVLDRSGSMSVMGNEVEGGANAYLDEQRKADVEDGARTSIVMCTFDSKVETLYNNADLAAIPAITHEQVAPRGTTALYDAIGKALVMTAEIVNKLDTKPSVSIFILTDGQENASRVWTKADVSAEISKLQLPENGEWDFYFAAANQDAMTTGSSLGMDREQCISFSGSSGAKMKQTMQMTNMAYQRKKKSYGMSKGWSAQERASCM